jgi:hypothetical protein
MKMFTVLKDMAALAGLGCLLTGLWLAWHPLAWIVGGAVLLVMALVPPRNPKDA